MFVCPANVARQASYMPAALQAFLFLVMLLLGGFLLSVGAHVVFDCVKAIALMFENCLRHWSDAHFTYNHHHLRSIELNINKYD